MSLAHQPLLFFSLCSVALLTIFTLFYHHVGLMFYAFYGYQFSWVALFFSTLSCSCNCFIYCQKI